MNPIIKKEKELKQDNFCGYKCTACGGGVQNCVPALLVKIDELEEKNTFLSEENKYLYIAKYMYKYVDRFLPSTIKIYEKAVKRLGVDI